MSEKTIFGSVGVVFLFCFMRAWYWRWVNELCVTFVFLGLEHPLRFAQWLARGCVTGDLLDRMGLFVRVVWSLGAFFVVRELFVKGDTNVQMLLWVCVGDFGDCFCVGGCFLGQYSFDCAGRAGGG